MKDDELAIIHRVENHRFLSLYLQGFFFLVENAVYLSFLDIISLTFVDER